MYIISFGLKNKIIFQTKDAKVVRLKTYSFNLFMIDYAILVNVLIFFVFVYIRYICGWSVVCIGTAVMTSSFPARIPLKPVCSIRRRE